MIPSGHTLVATEDSLPGFKAWSSTDGGPEHEIIMQIGSDVAWMCLIDYAQHMSEDDCFLMAGNLALNDKT